MSQTENALYAELDRLKGENARYAEAVLKMEKEAYYTDGEGYEYCRFCNCHQSHVEPSHFDDCVVMLAVAMAHKETADKVNPRVAVAGREK